MAVIVAVPLETPITTPSESTVATALLDDVHFTLVSVALEGVMYVLMVLSWLIPSSIVLSERVIPVTLFT